MNSGAYHYPPDLFNLLKDAIPKLNKSKSDLLVFFRGCGLASESLEPYAELLKSDKDSFSKYRVTAELLEKINQAGDVALAQRREIIKRVVEFQNFSGCYDSDRHAAVGLVAQIQQYVQAKDFLTRTQEYASGERAQRLAQQDEKLRALKLNREDGEKIKQEFYALFDEGNAQARGKNLEKVLNDLFRHAGISVREAFVVTGKNNEGIVEQIDGVIEHKGHLYLVEMKWLKEPVGAPEITQHIGRLTIRGGNVRGLYISYSGYAKTASTTAELFLGTGAVLILSSLQEIIALLNSEGDLVLWLDGKVNSALLERKSFVEYK